MEEIKVIIKFPYNLYARNANHFHLFVSSLKSEVFIFDKCQNRKVNAKSLFGLLSLSISQDKEVELILIGDYAKDELEKILHNINSKE